MIVMNSVVATVHTDEGYYTGLLITMGTKYASMIWPESTGMRINRLPLSTYNHKRRKTFALNLVLDPDYNVDKAKKHLRQCGRRFGITKAAKQELKV